MASQGLDKENQPARAGDKRRGTALEYPERKRQVFLLFLDLSKSTDEICRICKTDPMVHVGRHFGRTVSAVVTISSLVNNGISRQLRLVEKELTLDDLDPESQREHQIFAQLLKVVPDLLDLMDVSVEAGAHLCSMIQKGIANSRGEDTKGLKGVMIDWLTKPGVPLIPPLYRNSKSERGYNHPITGRLLCPAGWDWEDPNVVEGLRSGATKLLGEHWPVFIYKDNTYDPENPWKGAFRGSLLVKAYRHIFTSPSSVDLQEPKATRSGNARIHGMTEATLASIAYVATQVRFALSSHSVFSRSNCVTDTEQFYNTCMDLFLDKDELAEINALLLWWNRLIFPASLAARTPIDKNTPLARIRAKRAALLAAAASNASSNSGDNLQVPDAQPQLEPSPVTTAGGLQAPVENGTSSGGGEA
ncbi:hypothetical protein HWV62_5455 [Athelia sp. TMB]|nr:hypothetical protein HWV62_5455 [Athelia sp. TMB]